MHAALRERLRAGAGRGAEPPASAIDSQTAKTTERGGEHGSDGGKKLSGRKRHIVVDTPGLLLKAEAHAADILDRDGAPLLLEPVRQMFGGLSHMWADMGYRGGAVEWTGNRPGWAVGIVERPSKSGRYPISVEPPPMPRFTVLPRSGSSSAPSRG